MGKKRSSSKKKTTNSKTTARKAIWCDPDAYAAFFRRCQNSLADLHRNKEADEEKLRNALATYGNIYDNQKQ
jgi:hypothetical protein